MTYTQKNFDTFEERPFCPVDSLILSDVAYISFPDAVEEVKGWTGVPLCQLYLAEYFDEMFYGILTEEDTRKLFAALAASPRYRNIRVMGYTNQYDPVTEKQFCAMSFQLQPDVCYIAFRGTDTTFVGWKEDFNMAFQCPVPSQREAVHYLEKAALYCSGKIYTGGHSKGGNLAVYAAAMCRENIQSRIVRVYSHDGPGFLEETLSTPEFQYIAPRVEKTMPQSSIVGILFEDREDYRIIKSSETGGIMQHDPFTWILENNDFIYLEELTKDSRYADRTLSEWLKQISEEDRERFVEALYSVLNSNRLTTLEDFYTDWQKNVPAALQAASRLDGDTKKFLLRTLKDLAAQGIKNFSLLGKDKEK